MVMVADNKCFGVGEKTSIQVMNVRTNEIKTRPIWQFLNKTHFKYEGDIQYSIPEFLVVKTVNENMEVAFKPLVRIERFKSLRPMLEVRYKRKKFWILDNNPLVNDKLQLVMPHETDTIVLNGGNCLLMQPCHYVEVPYTSWVYRIYIQDADMFFGEHVLIGAPRLPEF